MLQSADFDALLVKNDGAPIKTLQPLVPHSAKIKALVLSAVTDSLSGLDRLTNLQVLDLGDISPDRGISLANLPQLWWLRLRWQNSLIPIGTSSFPALRSLSVLDPKSTTAEWVGDLKSLETLELKGGTVGSLVGISAASSLRWLELRRVRGCSDVSPLKDVKLRHLRIESSTDLSGLEDALRGQRELEELIVDSPTSFKALEWVEANPKLRELLIKIDPSKVDLTKIVAQRTLHAPSISYPSDQSLTDDQIKAAVQVVGRKLKWIERGGTQKHPWCVIHLE